MARQADVIAALTLEVLKGTTRAFDKGMSSPSHIYKECAVRKNIQYRLMCNFLSPRKDEKGSYDDCLTISYGFSSSFRTSRL